MTMAAREVLGDCRIAMQILESETQLPVWRVHWAGAVALLRAVGHVLEKVDGTSEELKKLVREAYQSWKDDRETHAIFWEFIANERNNILKEYNFNINPLEEIGIVYEMTSTNIETGEPVQISDIAILDENIYRPSLEGYRVGDDVRDIYSDAVDWWELQLSQIDAAAKLLR